jgi:hypothetical protein
MPLLNISLLEGVLSMRKFTISIFAATKGVALLVETATPGFAQAYCACWGTGNVMDEPLVEKTTGAYGYEMSVAPRQRMTGKSAYAYSPAAGSSSRHMKHKQR